MELKFIDRLNNLDFPEFAVGPQHMTDKFMAEHTRFATFSAMLRAAGLESLETADATAWDVHVNETTDFASWEEMATAAGSAKISRDIHEALRDDD